jgi:hypothetical protein
MNAPGFTLDHLPVLSADQLQQALVLNTRIAALNHALQVVDATATPEQITGRIRDLMHDAQSSLLDLYQRAALRQPGAPDA